MRLTGNQMGYIGVVPAAFSPVSNLLKMDVYNPSLMIKEGCVLYSTIKKCRFYLLLQKHLRSHFSMNTCSFRRAEKLQLLRTLVVLFGYINKVRVKKWNTIRNEYPIHKLRQPSGQNGMELSWLWTAIATEGASQTVQRLMYGLISSSTTGIIGREAVVDSQYDLSLRLA